MLFHIIRKSEVSHKKKCTLFCRLLGVICIDCPSILGGPGESEPDSPVTPASQLFTLRLTWCHHVVQGCANVTGQQSCGSHPSLEQWGLAWPHSHWLGSLFLGCHVCWPLRLSCTFFLFPVWLMLATRYFLHTSPYLTMCGVSKIASALVQVPGPVEEPTSLPGPRCWPELPAQRPS